MKILKVLSASAIAAAIAASISVPASAATTYEDVVDTAEACAVQAHNVQQLENFLEANDSHFSSSDYDKMVEKLEEICDTYVVPAAEEAGIPTDDLAGLSEEEKIEIGKVWTEDEKQAICDDLVAFGKEFGVTITIEKASNSHYDVTAVIEDTSSNSSSNSSSSTTDSTKKDSAVAPTGGEFEAGSNATAVAFGGIATLLAATGIIVVAKKNKD